MRLVFICSVTAMTPLRTISTITGSRTRDGAADFCDWRFMSSIPQARTVAWMERSVIRNRPRDMTKPGDDEALTLDYAYAPSGLRLYDSRSSLPDRDGEIAEAVALQGVAGHQHGRRCMLLDQRRPLDTIARCEPIACEGARVDEAVTLEVDRALAGARRLGRSGPAAGDLLQDGLAHNARYRGAQADDFGALRRCAGAVAQKMHVIEVALDRGAILFFEHLRRQVDRDGMLLADIAHIGGAVDRYLLRRHRGGGDGAPAFPFEFVVDAREIVKRGVVEPGRPGAHIVIAQV